MSYTSDRNQKTRGVGAIAASDLKNESQMSGAQVRTGIGPVRLVPGHNPKPQVRNWYATGLGETRDYRKNPIKVGPRKQYSPKEIANRRANRNAEQMAWDAADARARLAAQKKAKITVVQVGGGSKKGKVKPGRTAIPLRAGKAGATVPVRLPVIAPDGTPVAPPVSGGGSSSYGGGGGGGMPSGGGSASYGGGSDSGYPSDAELDAMGPPPEGAPEEGAPEASPETSPVQDIKSGVEALQKPMSGSTKLLLGLGIGYVLWSMVRK